MSRFTLLAVLILISAVLAINRSVYKIVLTQKGFAQFVQYDLETPPIREFTICTWIRVYELENDQSIFTYIVNGNNRVVRLWLDSGGRSIRVSFRSQEPLKIPVEVVRDVWRHVCLSYQSDFGAWALYIDSRLISCETTQTLHGFVIPAGGSVIVGYGTSDSGTPTGLEGEIFGVNMILTSTIDRNVTMKNYPQYTQKRFRKNKIRAPKNIDYVILKDLKTNEIRNVAGQTDITPSTNKSRSFIKLQTPKSFFDHDVSVSMTTSNPKQSEGSNEKEILDLVLNSKVQPSNKKPRVDFWNLVNEAGHAGKFKSPLTRRPEPTSSETQGRLTISEYETPPPPNSIRINYLQQSVEEERNPLKESSSYKINKEATLRPIMGKPTKMYTDDDISEVEVPPPPENDNKVYGQWTSSKYAGTVLNYLKSINFQRQEKKISNTLPLTKVSDSFPYPSEMKPNIVRPPTNIQRKKMIAEKQFHYKYIAPSAKHVHIEKRQAKLPEINVKVVENDLRSQIIDSHAQTRPRHVEITHRGITKSRRDNRMNDVSVEDKRDDISKRFTPKSNSYSDQVTSFDFHKSNSLFNGLPFLKSVEYFTGEDDSQSSNVVNANEMYTKSFYNTNKWHNIKSYNNFYTPRHTPALENNSPNKDKQISEANKRRPSIRMKYNHELHKVVSESGDESIVKGRELATDVSNQAKHNQNAVSILKYNHGYLPGHDKRSQLSHNKDDASNNLKFKQVNGNNNNFDKHVKIGNALNERLVIGSNEEQNKQSFVGGDEKVPDIQRYRSDYEAESEDVPSSLKPRVCKSINMKTNTILYVLHDGSIDTTDIQSPLKTQNVGILFVLQNYQRCSLEDSLLDRNYFVLIDWNKTPVRIFGGADPKKTKDLCGFF